MMPYSKFVSIQHEIERLRSRAAYYRREATRAEERARLIYCRALASHLEREAIELELVTRSRFISEESLRRSAAASSKRVVTSSSRVTSESD